jgi:hypothetical protein
MTALKRSDILLYYSNTIRICFIIVAPVSGDRRQTGRSKRNDYSANHITMKRRMVNGQP